MARQSKAILLVLTLGTPTFNGCAANLQPTIDQLCADFESYSGERLVFTTADLPPGKYHDSMPELSSDRQMAAARIACREARKLPPGYLRDVGLKTVGIFDRCVSMLGDGFREYDQELGGFRYYGIYNGRDAVAAAYYSDGQLPLTFHHEIFHHIDRVSHRTGKPREDDRLASALQGEQPYPPPFIAPDDLKSLRRYCEGEVLLSTVGDYAAKNVFEDKAETARHLMSTLADSLVQVVERPELPGSQRLLHVISLYDKALAGDGPGIDWFVDVALNRSDAQGAGDRGG